MDINRDDFYITLFSDASSEIYTLNSKTSFTNRLALPVDLGSSKDWIEGLVEISYKPPERMIVGGAFFTRLVKKTFCLLSPSCTSACRIGTQKFIANYYYSVANRSTRFL